MSRKRMLALCILLLAAGPFTFKSSPSAQVVSDMEDRWRTSNKEGKAYLYSADTDATDAYGTIRFACQTGSGNIDTEVQISDQDRSAIAKLISDENAYPSAKMLHSFKGRALIDRIDFDEMYGWKYHFRLDESDPSMTHLEKTGAFHFDLHGTMIGVDLKAGLAAISQFRQSCRAAKPPSSK